MKHEAPSHTIMNSAGFLLLPLLLVLCNACSDKPPGKENKTTAASQELDSLYHEAEKLHLHEQYEEDFMTFARQGVALATAYQDDSMLSKFYRLLSFYYLYDKRVNPDSSRHYVEQTMKHAVFSENKQVLSDALAIKSTYYYLAQRNYDSAITALKQQAQLTAALNDSVAMLVAIHAIAGLYEETEKFDTAWKYYNIVLDGAISIKKHDTSTSRKPHRLQYLHVMVLHDIAGLLIKQKNYAKALSYYEELDQLLPAKRKQFYPTVYTGIAECYEGLNEIDSAIKYYKIGVENFKNDHFSTTPNPYPYLKYAKLLVRQGQINEGEKYLQKASQVAWEQPVGEDRYILETQLALGEYYVLREKWKPAADTLQAALLLAKKLKKIESQAIIYQQLSLLNERRNNYKAALEYNKLLREYDDSLRAQNFARQASEMDAKYQAFQKTQEIILLQKDNRIQQLQLQAIRRTRIFYILGAIALLSIGGIAYYYRSKQQRARHNRVKVDLENKALRAQMNPHFIFNSLNAIQELIVTENYLSSYEYLSKFSRLLRMVLHNSDKNFIPLSQEIEMYHLYLELELLRFKNAFSYTITVSPHIDTDNILFPTLLMQPVIENALWHGLSQKQGEKLLHINFEERKGTLLCTVTDNGIGREKAAKIKAAKISAGHFESKGISLVQQRIETLKSDLDTRTSLDIVDCKDATDTPCGTKVEVQISVIENI